MGKGLVADGLCKSFGPRTVVRDVSLAVEPGEVVGLLGPNGAGKTTCFRIITGMLQPDAGTVSLMGVVLGRQPLWRRVRAGLGYLPQESTGFRMLSVRENLLIPLQARRQGVAEADALMDRVGLTHVAQTMAGHLSGGERRRLEIARCLAGKPSVMLLDEPFAGVDPVAVAELQQQIRVLAAEGIGILVTDHAVREALKICDRTVIIDSGVVIAEGSPGEIASNPRVRGRYLGEDFRMH